MIRRSQPMSLIEMSYTDAVKTSNQNTSFQLIPDLFGSSLSEYFYDTLTGFHEVILILRYNR
jgi:hypothetical protein